MSPRQIFAERPRSGVADGGTQIGYRLARLGLFSSVSSGFPVGLEATSLVEVEQRASKLEWFERLVQRTRPQRIPACLISDVATSSGSRDSSNGLACRAKVGYWTCDQ